MQAEVERFGLSDLIALFNYFILFFETKEIAMTDINNEELMDVEDIFENDELVIMKATFVRNSETVIETAVGIKDSSGDIVRIITISSKVI